MFGGDGLAKRAVPAWRDGIDVIGSGLRLATSHQVYILAIARVRGVISCTETILSRSFQPLRFHSWYPYLQTVCLFHFQPIRHFLTYLGTVYRVARVAGILLTCLDLQETFRACAIPRMILLALAKARLSLAACLPISCLLLYFIFRHKVNKHPQCMLRSHPSSFEFDSSMDGLPS